jgi:adenylylsulfate kinase
MTKRILIMGLPGSGKTTFSQELVKRLMLRHTIKWFNADAVRKEHNDWDFSPAGRLRQVERMREMADQSGADYAICDFVCPTEEYRSVFAADLVIWMDTIEAGRFEDTNRVFREPEHYDFRIRSWTENDTIIDQICATDLPRESHRRSIVKAISWRTLGTIDTFVLSWIITGQIHLAAAIGGVEVFTKMVLYYLHERAWARIKI